MMVVNTIQHNDKKLEPRVRDTFQRKSGMFGNMAHLKLHGYSHEVDICYTCNLLLLAYIIR